MKHSLLNFALPCALRMNLKTSSLKQNRLTIKPWFFDMEQGSILEYNEDKQDFITITQKAKA